MLKNLVDTSYTDEERVEYCKTLKYILGSVVVSFSSLPADTWSKLLYVPKQDVDQTLEDLHAILDILEDSTRSVRTHYPSFRDFLLSKDRCGDTFWVDEKQAHQTLADNCIQLMTASLKQDICGVNAPGMFVTEIERYQVERSLPPELQYACLY